MSPANADAPEIEALTERVRGPLLLPRDDGYDAERDGFQTYGQHRPDVIVGATGAADIQAAVEYADAHGLPIAVQATGHGMPAAADGGVLITTGRMTGVRVDAAERTAWFEAGVRWEKVVHEAAPHGLAPLSGSAPQVGAAAYTLGGGIPLLARRFGYAADHVRGVDVVTADARHRHVTERDDPDLFWALRGGRANFGVATGVQIDLVRLSRLYGGGLFFDADLAGDALDAWRRWTEAVPDEMTSSVALIPFPDVPVLPEPLRGRHVCHIRIAFTGEAAEGERLVEPLRSVGPRLMDRLGDMPYTMAGSIYNDPTDPMAYYGTTECLSDLDDSAVRRLLDEAGPGTPDHLVVEIRHLGGALAKPAGAPNAVGNRDARYAMNVVSRLNGTTADAAQAAHRRLHTALTRWITGARCLNFLAGNSTIDQVRSAYDPDDYSRLAELKARYDPANIFRLNHDIPPAPARRASR